MESVFIIAEAGVNHNGSLEKAFSLVDIAKNSGADAVKFQTFKAEKLVSKKAQKAEYQIRNTGKSESQFEMLKKLELSKEDHKKIFEYCKTKEIEFLSTPFDEDSLDYLVDELGVSRIKISSGDLTNGPLLLAAARKNIPVILSTGMGTLLEIKKSLSVLAFGYLHPNGNPPEYSAFLEKDEFAVLKSKVTILHCTTEYPADLEDLNLKSIAYLKDFFNLRVGFSDHSQGIEAPIGAVSQGAAVIEKHFTSDKNLSGPDHKASLDPRELKLMVEGIRSMEVSLGEYYKNPRQSELKNMVVARKTIVAAKSIKKGECFSEKNMEVKRAGSGLSPMDYWSLIGRKSSRDYVEEDIIDE
ncbi:MAG: N-acetylneuraminate synthase [Oligoflexia bacterium]|nr:N-acetylneuraminate synthase [Oligoflexia bacterium]